jgi:hypothetical protein
MEGGIISLYIGKWKTTSIFWQNGRRPQFFGKMEDDLIFWQNGRRPYTHPPTPTKNVTI